MCRQIDFGANKQIDRQIKKCAERQRGRERERNIERKKVIIDRWMDPQSERMIDRQIDGQKV